MIDRSEYLDDYGLQVDPLFDMIDEKDKTIKELASALKEAAEIIGLNVDFDIQKSVPDKYRAIANKYLTNTPPIKEE